MAKFAIYRLEYFMNRFNKEISVTARHEITSSFVKHELPLIINELWEMEVYHRGKTID